MSPLPPVDGVSLTDDLERPVQDVVCDTLPVHEQPPEEGVVQDGSHRLVSPGVQRCWGVEQVKGRQEYLTADLQLVGCLVKLPGDVGSFVADGIEPGTQLVLGPTLVSRQVQKVVLLAVELGQPVGELCPQVGAWLGADSHRFVDCRVYPLAQLSGQHRQRLVMLFDQLFHDVHRHVGVVTPFLLPSPTEKVEIFSTSTAAWHEGKAVTTAPTPDQPFEVVLVFALPGAATAVRIHDALDPLE
nr:hypothetical protein [Actinokineospora sp. NBRC 105648]